ncbi:Peptidyl-prolyl isomerase PASTICCINO1 [Triticum urartu]|uniref:peptidylprolyl isomerase n=1 Tax=Triticum urartu TaxID=4572 RepID=M8ASC4_TRIUA|nr:Peptidyl-prolyl isomerase PASTICCINO1 [Triticum urartu]
MAKEAEEGKGEEGEAYSWEFDEGGYPPFWKPNALENFIATASLTYEQLKKIEVCSSPGGLGWLYNSMYFLMTNTSSSTSLNTGSHMTKSWCSMEIFPAKVILHCTIRTMEGIVVNSTRREHGGKGIPLRFVLGKSKMILGFAEGFPTMLKGEIAMFKMEPKIHYAEDDCPVTPPDGFPKDDELQFEVEMLDFFKAKVNDIDHDMASPMGTIELSATRNVASPVGYSAFRVPWLKVVTEDLGVVKKIVDEGKGWETPREPYEVTARTKRYKCRSSSERRTFVSMDVTFRESEPFMSVFLHGDLQEEAYMEIPREFSTSETVGEEIQVAYFLTVAFTYSAYYDITYLLMKNNLTRTFLFVISRITARTADGKEILPSKEVPYFFTLGKSEAPKGLEMGIGTMARKEKATIYVTSTYLTESSVMPQLEGLEEVHFEVELVQFTQVRDMLGDGRLIKRRVVDGSGEFPMDCPLHDSLLRVHYKGMLLDEPKSVFYDTQIDNDGEPLEFCSGEGLVPEGFEMCVRLMLPGEKSIVTCPPDFAYDKFPRPANVPEGAHVRWEIELLGFEVPKDWTGLTFKEIMEEADKIKNTGNRLFKEGKFELAKAKYEKSSLHLNVAACYQKMGEYRKSIEACNKDGSMEALGAAQGCERWILSARIFGWGIFGWGSGRSRVGCQGLGCRGGGPGGGSVVLMGRAHGLVLPGGHGRVGGVVAGVWCSVAVLDANPVHVKALYRRGMSYMLGGDFDDAKNDFEKMVTVDKSSEPDATAALVKLKQKEQEIEKKARKQFKGLFDKKPGEISEVGVESKNGGDTAGSGEAVTSRDRNGSGKSSPPSAESDHAFDEERPGLIGRIWPSARRIFSSLGLNRCTIL